MNIIFVTSFGSFYYDRIARHTLPRLVKATYKYKLYVYYENEINLNPALSLAHVDYKDIYHCSPKLIEFLASIKDDKVKYGLKYHPANAGIWTPEQRKSGYNYKLNAFSFCRKWFVLQHAFNRLTRRYEHFVLVWLDADILLHSYLHNFEQHINDTFINGGYIGFLDRDFIHSECGFMLFKSGSPSYEIINGVCDMYSSKNVFTLPEWHDSYVFDEIRSKMKREYFVPMALGRQNEDVFSKSVMGNYASHLKGRLKYQAKEIIQDGRRCETIRKTA